MIILREIINFRKQVRKLVKNLLKNMYEIKILFFFFLFSFFCISCNDLRDNQEEVIFNNFRLIKPLGWELVKLEGIDSQVGVLITKSGDTINYEYGKNAQKIESNLLKVLPDNMSDDSTNESIFRYSKSPDLDQDLGIFLNEYFIFDSIKN